MSAALFDPASAWDRLPAGMQRELGIAAVTYAIGFIGADQAGHHIRAFDAAEIEANWRIEAIVREQIVLAGGRIVEDMAPPDLAAIGVRSCEVCGCTDSCACLGGCSWVGERLCSACAGEAA